MCGHFEAESNEQEDEMFYGDEDDKEAEDEGSDSAEEVQETKKVLKTNL
jgi:hypothetical protein